jgi:O-antigen ligase
VSALGARLQSMLVGSADDRPQGLLLRRGLFAAFVVGLGASITLSQSALAALAVLWLWRLRDPAVRRAQSWPLWKPMLLFAGVTVVSALVSNDPWDSLPAGKSLLLGLALYVTADALDGPEDAERFLSVLSIVVALAAVIGLLQFTLCPSSEVDTGTPRWLYHRCYRARGPFSIYMTLAGVLSLVLLAGLPRLLPGAPRRRWFLPLWVIMLAGLVATYTRGAWIGFAGGVVSLLPATRRGRLVLIAGLVALALVLLAGGERLRQRALSMADPEDATVRERIYMWRSGLDIWRAHPWLGVGTGGVKREYQGFALPEAVQKRTSHVHNTPLQIMVERGVLGLGAWLLIWIAFFVEAVNRLRRLGPEATAARAIVVGSMAAIVGFLIGGLSEFNFGDSEVVLVAWSLMALPYAVTHTPTRQPPTPAVTIHH